MLYLTHVKMNQYATLIDDNIKQNEFWKKNEYEKKELFASIDYTRSLDGD